MKTLSVGLATLLLAGSAHAADGAEPCGGLKLSAGKVELGRALPAEATPSAETEACLVAIAKTVLGRPAIRGVSVIARVSDTDRGVGNGLSSAQAVVDRLVSAGLPRARVSALAPRVDAADTLGLSFTYAEAPFDRPVGLVLKGSGEVTLGRSDDAMQAAATGAPVRTFDRVRTGEKSAALLRLAEGSTLLLGPGTALRVGQTQLNEKLKRQVQLELFSGEVEVDAASGGEGSVFEIATEKAAARVLGTRFRLAAAAGATRIEVLEGTVAFAASGKEIELRPGQAARVGESMEPARALLPQPQPEGPVLGKFQRPPQLRWKSVSGASSYRVELARSADFTDDPRRVPSSEVTAEVGDAPDGKWFWRVLAADADGFVGLPSRVHAFTVDASYTPPAPPPAVLPPSAPAK
jgi:hypothetical protein